MIHEHESSKRTIMASCAQENSGMEGYKGPNGPTSRGVPLDEALFEIHVYLMK